MGAVARFKYELEVQVSAHIGTPGGKTVIVHPFQEMKVTKSVFRPGGIIYSGLVKADGETFYLDKVPDDRLYSQPEWSALLPERLADPFAIGGKRDFTPELPPAEPGHLCVLVRTVETGGRAVVKALAAAPAEEMLMGAISEDVARLAAQEVIPAGLPFETMTESDPHSPECAVTVIIIMTALEALTIRSDGSPPLRHGKPTGRGRGLMECLGIYFFLHRKNVYIHVPGDRPRDYKLVAKLRVEPQKPEVDITGLDPYPESISAVEIKRPLAKKLLGQTLYCPSPSGQ